MLQQKGGGLQQQRGVRVLCAEAQVGEHTSAQQDVHGALGEALRRAQCIAYRQLQHQVRAAQDGGLCPEMLGQHRGAAPLDKITRHTADRRTVPAQGGLGRCQLVGMALVKGVVFRHNAANPHKNPPKMVVKRKRMV